MTVSRYVTVPNGILVAILVAVLVAGMPLIGNSGNVPAEASDPGGGTNSAGAVQTSLFYVDKDGTGIHFSDKLQKGKLYLMEDPEETGAALTGVMILDKSELLRSGAEIDFVERKIAISASPDECGNINMVIDVTTFDQRDEISFSLFLSEDKTVGTRAPGTSFSSPPVITESITDLILNTDSILNKKNIVIIVLNKSMS